MPETEFNAQFFEQFLDDYFAESEEHLRSVRRNILDLEDALTSGHEVKKDTLNELFRSFHTLKGISAMAGVSAAETLAHFMESYLRLLRDGQTAISEAGIRALIKSTQKVEEIVAARRADSEIPSIDDETRLLDELANETGGPIRTFDAPAAAIDSDSLYLFTFVSASELAERNVNVNSVRERLQQIGTIINSRPIVREGGQVAFEFSVETDESEELFRAWAADGIEFERVVDEIEVFDDVTAGRQRLLGQSNVVRVELSRLDALMLMVGELVVSRAKLDEQLKQIAASLPGDMVSHLEETNHAIELQLRDLRDGVMRTRMTPIGEVFERLEFAVRDLARDIGKKVGLEISGENTEIDKMLVEKVLDPLLHLVRNAVSHGIEEAAGRIAEGKPEIGVIRLHASTVGESIVLEVSDDGAGIDIEKVAARASERGLIKSRSKFDEAELLDILSIPGFSTKDHTDKASGRGVGMDVVRRAVDELNGTISLETRAHLGTTFTIQLPLTLAIADALIVAVDKERFAVPQAGVREVIEVERSAVRRLENNEIIEYRGAALPLVRLSKLFALDDAYREVFHAFVVGEGQQAVGIAVDRVIGQAEIVIRAVSDPLTQVPGISGATELGDGRLVLILDVTAITRRLKEIV
ncbi:MAG: chemotaxis protein CheA [Acidobacteriota bacterium]